MENEKQPKQSLWSRFIHWVTFDRKSPQENRERVGQNLMISAVFLFAVFIINYAVLIGTDSKFGVKLSEQAKAVYQTSRTIQAKRGTIYDRNGIAIAEDATTYSVYAIIDKDYVAIDKTALYVEEDKYSQVAEILNRYLEMETDYVLGQLKLENLSQTYFGTKGNNISYSTMKAMEAEFENAGIKGMAFSSNPARMYPNGVFASHFIGLAQSVENEDYSKSLVGQTGFELAFNDILSGEDGVVTYQKDRNGIIQLGTATIEKEAVDGQDVYTTLSAPIQIHLENQLQYIHEQSRAVYSSATLVKAKTGEILATSQRPTYNADTKEGLDSIWQTFLYQTNYEPGSTLKVLTTAAAIDAGVFDPNETYYNNELVIADATIRDWEINMGRSEGRTLTMANALPYSSNIGMSMLQQKMGSEEWTKYLTKFRMGFPTRFGMTGEEAGIFPANNIVTHAMSSFGQGINVTQTQMLRVFSAIANDGEMLQPRVVSKIYDPNTNTERIGQAEVMGNPVSASAARTTRDYMVAVGTDPVYGTLYAEGYGPIIQVGDYSVAVKSGTAEIAATVEEGGGYLTGDRDLLYSVVAMVPAEDPEYIMYATVQQPQEGWSGMLWVDLINPILEDAMIMTDSLAEPTAELETGSYILPDLIGQTPGPVADDLRRHLVHPIILGTGNKILQMSYEVGEDLAPNTQLMLLTNDFDTLPDMYGWTKKNVQAFAEWMGIDITIKGKGRVVSQTQEIGTSLSDIKSMTVTLSND